MGDSDKNLLKTRDTIFTALPLSNYLVTLLFKATRLVRRDFPFGNPCQLLPITILPLVHLAMFHRIIYSQGWRWGWPICNFLDSPFCPSWGLKESKCHSYIQKPSPTIITFLRQSRVVPQWLLASYVSTSGWTPWAPQTCMCPICLKVC